MTDLSEGSGRIRASLPRMRLPIRVSEVPEWVRWRAQQLEPPTLGVPHRDGLVRQLLSVDCRLW